MGVSAFNSYEEAADALEDARRRIHWHASNLAVSMLGHCEIGMPFDEHLHWIGHYRAEWMAAHAAMSRFEPRRLVCDYCGSADPPNHRSGCASQLAGAS